MKVHFLTFGSAGWNRTVDIISDEAAECRVFDRIWAMREHDLGDWRHRDAARSQGRGHGHWGWKPYLARKTMAQMEDGDLLVYCDAGCVLSPNDAEWRRYFNLATAHGFVGFFTDHNEAMYTKADTFAALELPAPPIYPPSTQLWAGAWLMEKNPANENLLATWDLAFDTPQLVNDEPSVLPNAADFVEHRHDQSVLSLLVKKHTRPRGWLSHAENFRDGMPIRCARRRVMG